MKPYNRYKKAKTEWISRFPEHWREYKGKYLFHSQKRINRGMVCENILALTLGGVINKDISKNEGLLPKDFSSYQIFQKDDLVFKLIDLENFKTSRVGIVHEEGIMSPAYIRITNHKRIVAKFFYYLYYDFYNQGIYNFLGQGVRSSLNSSDLLDMMVLAPPLPEQQAIADFLEHKTAQIDTLIQKKQRQIELLQEYRTVLINQAVTEGLNPDVPMKDSGIEWLGEIPAHWETLRFKYCFSIRSGQVNPTEDQFKNMVLIAPNHIESQTGTMLQLETADEQGAESGKYFFYEGDVLYSKIRPELRKACIAPSEGLCSADMYAIVPREFMLKEFSLYLLLSNSFSLFTIEKSMRVAMPKVNRESLSEYSFAIPPVNEQIEILEHITRETSVLDNVILKNKVLIDFLNEYRTALISEVVTGKIDVRGWKNEH